jgi:hypothetical protein
VFAVAESARLRLKRRALPSERLSHRADVDIDVDLEVDGDGDLDVVGTFDERMRRKSAAQNILVSMATIPSSSSMPRWYFSGLTSFLSFRMSSDDAHSIASPREIL